MANKRKLKAKEEAEGEYLADDEAEENVVASIILDPDCMGSLDLSPNDFHFYETSVIFGVALAMWQCGEPIDQATISYKLPAGASFGYISGLLARVPTPVHVEHYANRVKDMALRRNVMEVGGAIHALAREGGLTNSQIFDQASELLEQLRWPSLMSRFVIFRNGAEIKTNPPTYAFDVIRPKDGFTHRIRFTSAMLSSKKAFTQQIREHMSLEPLLPGKEKWGDFLNHLIYLTEKSPGPETASHDEDVMYWFYEWFKRAPVIDAADELVAGYAQRGNWRYFQVQRLLSWLKDRVNTNQSELWAILLPYGPRRDHSVRLKDTVRKLWGVKEEMFGPTDELVEDEQIAMPDEEDTTWLE